MKQGPAGCVPEQLARPWARIYRVYTQVVQPVARTREPSTGPLRARPSPPRLSEGPSQLGGADEPEDGGEDGNGGNADGCCRGASATLSLKDGLEAVQPGVLDGDFWEPRDDSMP